MPAEPPLGSRIRVVVFGVRRLMGELLSEALAEDPEIDIALVTGGQDNLSSIVSERGADVVILGDQVPHASAAFEILRAVRPHLKVLTITNDGRETFLYELRPHEVALGQLSGGGLLDAVRDRPESG
jgi:chemotaxis response regulator CheB